MNQGVLEAPAVLRLGRAWAMTVVVGTLVVASLPTFFRWIGPKPGMLPPEPLLHHLSGMDLSVPLFGALYLVVGAYLIALLRHRERFLRAAQAYLLLLLMRMVAMAVVTLEPPPGLVMLQDPMVQWFYPGNEPFLKDLFFSGHVATVCLLALAAPWPAWRPWLWVFAGLVAAAVLVQHIHWTVDVVAAPLFAWAAWEASGFTFRLSTGAHEGRCP